MKRVLLAGATGYLGSYIAKELYKRGYFLRSIVRNPEKLKQRNTEMSEMVKAEVTQPETIKESCKNIEVVISTIGITRQKDGLSYLDVDFQANMNLLKQAKKSGVNKFIFVSVLNGDKLRHLKILFVIC
jgi:nucleoside-diphosphate-sugar epimerase